MAAAPKLRITSSTFAVLGGIYATVSFTGYMSPAKSNVTPRKLPEATPGLPPLAVLYFAMILDYSIAAIVVAVEGLFQVDWFLCTVNENSASADM